MSQKAWIQVNISPLGRQIKLPSYLAAQNSDDLIFKMGWCYPPYVGKYLVNFRALPIENICEGRRKQQRRKKSAKREGTSGRRNENCGGLERQVSQVIRGFSIEDGTGHKLLGSQGCSPFTSTPAPPAPFRASGYKPRVWNQTAWVGIGNFPTVQPWAEYFCELPSPHLHNGVKRRSCHIGLLWGSNGLIGIGYVVINIFSITSWFISSFLCVLLFFSVVLGSGTNSNWILLGDSPIILFISAQLAASRVRRFCCQNVLLLEALPLLNDDDDEDDDVNPGWAEAVTEWGLCVSTVSAIRSTFPSADKHPRPGCPSAFL